MIVPFYIFNQISIVPAQSKLLSNKISSHDRILIFITTVKPRVARKSVPETQRVSGVRVTGVSNYLRRFSLSVTDSYV